MTRSVTLKSSRLLPNGNRARHSRFPRGQDHAQPCAFTKREFDNARDTAVIESLTSGIGRFTNSTKRAPVACRLHAPSRSKSRLASDRRRSSTATAELSLIETSSSCAAGDADKDVGGPRTLATAWRHAAFSSTCVTHDNNNKPRSGWMSMPLYDVGSRPSCVAHGKDLPRGQVDSTAILRRREYQELG